MNNKNQTKGQKNKKSPQLIKPLFILLLLMIFGYQSSSCQKKGATIYGKITQKASENPIAFAAINIYKKNKKVGTINSDINGNYNAKVLAGVYDFEASFKDHTSYSKQNTKVSDGDSLMLNFTLQSNEILTLSSSPSSEIVISKDLQSISNAEASINENQIITSPINQPPSLKISKNKLPAKKERPRISPAKYEAYRNKDAKSPFRYPVAKIPIVTKTDDLENLIRTLNMDNLPNDKNGLEEINIENLINSLDYNYPVPKNDNKPFEVYTELFPCTWNDEKRLIHIGIKAISKDSLTALSQTTTPMAEDVRINVEFNPAYVRDYRLVGYEDYFPNLLSYKTDPTLNATIHEGQSLTAIYEFTPIQGKFADEEQKLLYQNRPKSLEENNELGAVQIFYRAPSARKKWTIKNRINRFLKPDASIEEKTFLAVGLADIAMRLRGSPNVKSGSINDIIETLQSIENKTENGYKILDIAEKIQKLESEYPK